MNIGLDLDNVITNFDFGLLTAFLKEDKLKRNSGIINKNAEYISHGMFDWSKQEIEDFYASKMENLSATLHPRYNCKKVIDKLMQQGHKIYIITYRVAPHYKNAKQTTSTWLMQHKINYTNLVFAKGKDKTDECKQLKIDVMVDDLFDECKNMAQNGIKCVMMQTKFNIHHKTEILTATSWKNLYSIICTIKK
ncbi:MAG: hypothetical protein MJ152_00045 [Clostridia bacterium]|nr:hypothetical protein [Clostridia bacterium]